MNKITLGPELKPDGDQALRFIRTWFAAAGQGELIQLIQIKRASDTVKQPLSLPVSAILQGLSDNGLEPLTWDDGELNLYVCMGTLKERPKGRGRGGRSNIKAHPGVWMDFDIKDGGFDSQEEILACVRKIQPYASVLVNTGTGGVHAYWRADQMLPPEETERICNELWATCEEISGRKIDRLSNPDRIMRLPGSIRWPKTDDEPVTRAELIYLSEEMISADVLASAWTGAWTRVEERRQQTSRSIGRARQVAVSEIGSDRWAALMMISEAEDTFADQYSWEQILEPHGWTKMGEDYEGRTVWQRPGGKDGKKAATTDWPESPNTMSLFSTAVETGLLELHDAAVPLTKYRVHVQLTWNGDEAAFLREWMKE